MDDGGGRGFTWAAIGCGSFLLLGICAATGIAAYLIVRAPISFDTPGAAPSAPVDPSLPTFGNPVAPRKPEPPAPDVPPVGVVHAVAEVTSVTGAAPVPVGTECTFDIEPRARQDGSPWCHTEVRCGGRVVYGGGQSGFFPCAPGETKGSMRGRDDHTTRDDGDASLLVDTEARTLSIGDDETGPNGAFGLEARITRVE